MNKLLGLVLIATLSTLGCSNANRKADQQANPFSEKDGLTTPTKVNETGESDRAATPDFPKQEPANTSHVIVPDSPPAVVKPNPKGARSQEPATTEIAQTP